MASAPKQKTAINYVDNLGNPIHLGSELAQGGEGIVYNIQGKPNLVAKLYKPKALNKKDTANKIKAMCDLYDDNITQFAAMPQKVIYSGNKVRGFVMEKIADFKEIHLLYGTKNRKKYFPNADWGFMVHSALNFARAVESLHNKGIVIGDINQSNILVNKQAMIKFIDCDSYQVDYQGNTYLCEVGVPEYTSPELQGKSFHGVHRTTNHDGFGLAVIIFKILMLGRHPYSGKGAPPEIENSIKQGCFCYGRNYHQKTAFYSDLFSVLSDELKDLFEQAYTTNNRPSAADWVKALDNFEKQLGECSRNDSHRFNKNTNRCIWCDFERNNFVPFKPTSAPKQPQPQAPTKKKPNYTQTPYNSYRQNNSTPTYTQAPPAKSSDIWNFIVGSLVVLFIIGALINAGNNTHNTPTVQQPSTNYENTKTFNEPTDIKTEAKNESPQTDNSIDNNQDNTKETSQSNQATTKKYNNPNEYLSQVKQIIQNNWKTTYSIDCTAVFTPPNNVKIINDEWNGDVAYNLLLNTNIPKYTDANGKTVPIVIKFSGHNVSSVTFQTKSAAKENSTKQNAPQPTTQPRESDALRPDLMDFANGI